MAYRMEQNYVGWYKRYVKFHEMRHSRDLGKAWVEAFLNHFAVNRMVAPATRNQAFNALLRSIGFNTPWLATFRRD